MIRYAHLETPIGRLGVVADGDALIRLEFLRKTPAHGVSTALELDSTTPYCRALSGLVDRINAYFDGELDALNAIRCRPAGTAFQQRVWQALRRIPVGVTSSYGRIALALGKPGAARAVGAANGANPVPLVIPCHRVIGADGRLGGFSSGLDLKTWLLRHEGVEPAEGQLTLAFLAGSSGNGL